MSDTKFEKGNKRSEKHGGEAATRAISRGQPFTGLAAEEEQTVTIQMEDEGPVVMAKVNAVRLQTASNLYWNALVKAIDDGNLELMDRYVARFGWLAQATQRALDQVVKYQKDNNTKVTFQNILAAYEEDNDNDQQGN